MHYCTRCGYLGTKNPHHSAPMPDDTGTCGWGQEDLSASVPENLVDAFGPLREMISPGLSLCIFIEAGGLWVRLEGPHGRHAVGGEHLIKKLGEVIRGARGAA